MKTIWNFLNKLFTFLGILVILAIGLFVLWEIISDAPKQSALSLLLKMNLLPPFIVFLVSFAALHIITFGIQLLIADFVSYELSEKLSSELQKVIFITSLTLGLLYTSSEEGFEFLATLVSFLLIFSTLFPKSLKKTLVDIRANIQHKWRNHKDKKNNQK